MTVTTTILCITFWLRHALTNGYPFVVRHPLTSTNFLATLVLVCWTVVLSTRML